MAPDAAFALELAVVAGLLALIVAIVIASSGACGAGTLVTYDQAKATMNVRRASVPPAAEGKEHGEEEEAAAASCAICLSEYARGDELVRVLPACGHFFHAGCGIDWWLRARGTCPYCRAGLWPLPECPPMPPRRAGGATVGWP